MSDCVVLRINGRECSAKTGARLLDVLREHGCPVPSLCWYESKRDFVRCSLCVVEVNGKIAHACSTPVDGSMEICTDAPQLTVLRAQAAALLLQRGPFRNDELTAMLHQLKEKGEDAHVCLPQTDLSGDVHRDFRTSPPGCILCGRCVAVCNKAGKHKLSMLGRGRYLRVAATGEQDCGRCRACAKVCPTHLIESNGGSTFTAYLYKNTDK